VFQAEGVVYVNVNGYVYGDVCGYGYLKGYEEQTEAKTNGRMGHHG